MEEVSRSTLAKRPRLDSAMYSLNETASLLGMGYTTVWTQVQEGTFPITPVKIGRRYLFPKVAVNRLLGIEADANGSTAA